MGDAMDKHCLQNPLDVVEGVTHAGQAATRHVTLHTDYIFCCDYYATPPHPPLLSYSTSVWHDGRLIFATPGVVRHGNQAPPKTQGKRTLTARPSACCW